jgi:hypothetical protein
VNLSLIEQFCAMYELPTSDEGAELVLVDGMSPQTGHGQAEQSEQCHQALAAQARASSYRKEQ